ncbi:hypothetical protein [Humibacter sp.]|uniref:hypothetical protein n=1 Tax=Humibacter sp. TaxID=1940291 RepID=UPI003F7E4696
MTTWELHQTGETATGPTLAVAADGALVAMTTALWDDDSGVRVSVDWSTDLDDLSVPQALALASALVELAALQPPV